MTSPTTDNHALLAAQNSEVLVLLNKILAMSDLQRLSLEKAWAAMDPSFGLELPQGGFFPVEDEGQASIVDPSDVAKLNDWMTDQQALLPRDRIAKLQAVLNQETEEWAITLLNAEIAKVKDTNPWLAVEIATMKYAYEHPVLMAVALAGLGLGIYRFGKAIFAAVF